MNVPVELLDEFAARVADALAPKIAVALRDQLGPAAADPWRLLDVEQAAARLGRSSRWLRGKAKSGAIPYVRLDGGALAFELDDLRAFAASRRVSAENVDLLAPRLHALGDPASRAGLRAADPVKGRTVARHG